MYYSNKKKFSNELIQFLGIENKPYYLSHIYSIFLDKINDCKSYGSYKLNNEIKNLLVWNYGTYVRASQIKRQIKEHHVISAELPNNIYSLSTLEQPINVQVITY